MEDGIVHVPILEREILAFLHLKPGDAVVDATVDGGGHATAALAAIAPTGRLLGLDRDPALLAVAQARLAADVSGGRAVLVQSNFAALASVAAEQGFTSVRAVLFDLGVSSFHFDRSGRGFSFARDEPLDMRFDASSESAAEILASRSVRELTDIFGYLGEERFAGRIAHSVVRMREQAPIERSTQLLEAIERALPAPVRWQASRSAARVFQALRIAANDELSAVEEALPQAFELLAAGGKLAVLSFHSLEDRLVKKFMVARKADGTGRILTKKPIMAGPEEVAENSRAASAKLRVCERL